MVKSSKNWYKHLDFMILDVFCIIIAFFIAIIIRHGIKDFSQTFDLYQSALLIIILVDLLYAILAEPYKNILKRGYFIEFTAVLKQSFSIFIALIVTMYALKQTYLFSRIVSFLFPFSNLVIAYIVHIVYKVILKKTAKRRKPKDYVMLIGTSSSIERLTDAIMSNDFMSIAITGIMVTDRENIRGTEYKGIPIVEEKDMYDFLQKEVVDEVFIDVNVPNKLSYSDAIIGMGLTVNFGLDEVFGYESAEIRKYCGISVASVGINRLSNGQIFAKRCIDILFGIIGSIFTILITIIIGPLIFINSPGKIFFRQKRVGKNGRLFYIWKYRTMYPDAEKRKEALLEKNEMKGQMFKMENDPRIIGSGPDGTKKGIGYFLRKTSLDEFPQFFNLLKGDMSLVGTRPPTVDEVAEYERHHMSRLAMKPGITGMWQVSGRSEIMDFEKVVELDNYYIKNFSIGLDFKIIGKTFVVLFNRRGAK